MLICKRTDMNNVLSECKVVCVCWGPGGSLLYNKCDFSLVFVWASATLKGPYMKLYFLTGAFINVQPSWTGPRASVIFDRSSTKTFFFPE